MYTSSSCCVYRINPYRYIMRCGQSAVVYRRRARTQAKEEAEVYTCAQMTPLHSEKSHANSATSRARDVPAIRTST